MPLGMGRTARTKRPPMLHSDGLPSRALAMLRKTAGRAMTTAEVARALGVADKSARAACASLERAGQIVSEPATNPSTKRPMRAWRIAQQLRSALWDPTQEDSCNERLKQGRRRAQQMACGPYPGRDIRYQLPDDWEPPDGGFRKAGIGNDGLTGKPWEERTT